MSFVKALFSTIVSEDFTLAEGKVGYTEHDRKYLEMEKDGKVKLFKTQEDADNYEFKSSMQLFHESFKSLNPPEGQNVESTLNFNESKPAIVDGAPANLSEKDKLDNEKDKDLNKKP